MTMFLLKRLSWMILTLWVVFTISFVLIRATPGSPFTAERKVSPEVERNMQRRYRLDLPVHQQYVQELARFARFDFGESMKIADYDNNSIIRQGFPVSASLGVLALAFALSLGLTAGIVSAVRRKTIADLSLMTVATAGIALPNFVIAGIATIFLVFLWPVFPPAGWNSAGDMILPAFCLGAPYAAYIARLTRTGMLDVLQQDYIRTAHAKGLAAGTVIFKHALRGALMPVVSFLGPAIAGLLTGSLVIERIFAIPGLGVTFIKAVEQRDYTLCMALVVLFTALVYGLNMLCDMAYTVLDPRIKLE